MKADLGYSSIGRDVVMRVGLDAMSWRDRVVLLRDLMEDLGISQDLMALGDAAKPAVEVMDRKIAEAWNRRET